LSQESIGIPVLFPFVEDGKVVDAAAVLRADGSPPYFEPQLGRKAREGVEGLGGHLGAAVGWEMNGTMRG
jgi:hypothetical protein